MNKNEPLSVPKTQGIGHSRTGKLLQQDRRVFNLLARPDLVGISLRCANKEIAVLDFGSQYTHLIARRIRQLGVISHIYPNDVKANKLKNTVGIILSGGPKSVNKAGKLAYDQAIFKLKVPVLGICYSHQLIINHFGGIVKSGKTREYGLAKMQIKPSPIFNKVKPKTTVWMSHGDHVAKLAAGFKSIATTNNDPLTAVANENKKIYGLQFHPEVTHTQAGEQILHNFVFDICRADKNWTTTKMLEQIQTNIKKEVGDKNVFLLISGGVDSTVCFALLEKTLGKDRVYGLHVDHGLMRQNEAKEVNKALKKIGLDDLYIYNAETEYLNALQKVVNPEKKRFIIGELFLNIANKVMQEKNMSTNKWLLGQGTIYPDTIESGGTKNADLIKTHHNRVPRIEQMIKQGKIIEPIKELYKDGVRQIGLKLGLPKKLIWRHPFPGPGLGIRCLCSNGSKKSTKLITDSLNNFYKLPIKSVGIQGDERTYAHPALIAKKTNWKKLTEISPQITNKYKNINRVLYLLAGNQKKIASSYLNKAYLTKKRLNNLRQIDAVVNKYIFNNPNCNHIWQLPVILVPFGYNKKETIILRPVESTEAMTVSWTQIPNNILNKIIKEITKLKLVDFIFYDITNKPPGTIEWE